VTDVRRHDFYDGKYGNFVTNFADIVAGWTTSLDDVLIWTGVTEDDTYKTSKMVFLRIPAGGKSFQFQQGVDAATNAHYTAGQGIKVSFEKDFYIGVFEVTQGQLAMVGGPSHSYKNTIEGTRRPVENLSYRELRDSANSSSEDSLYPAPPSDNSMIGKLRIRMERLCDFDLPSEAQWEYAARAGHGEGYWNDGSRILSTGSDANLMLLCRYAWNTQHPGTTQENPLPADDNTNLVGQYIPNSWGLYDMHGNVNELCLDWWTEDASERDSVSLGGVYTGAVNANGLNYADGVTQRPNPWRITRGGGYNSGASSCCAWTRNKNAAQSYGKTIGFRLICPTVVK
jgi:formylglycine-generating enzyme required for sulfatase activity